ncbi:TraX family protein [Companilactobacillus sp. HBUAS56275]|uniref:Conjugal transfer protein TraX n=1 Tax=Candidatus Companilactobacillus pullicola TaxID=2838523 RepID=A0A9D1ZM12_9LACO|nr:conjugal transfer protein TraX [Candidatus Companilactobacillus pullicola]
MRQFTPSITHKAMNRDIFKLLLMGLMVLDHINYFISPYLADIFHIITRVVAVGFAYLVVEGLHYTHSRKDYLIRLGGWGIFMAVGNYLMNLFVLRKDYAMSIIGDNIFLTLFVGAVIICLWDNHQEQKKKQLLRVVSIILLLIGIMPVLEGSFIIFPFMLITQVTHQNIKKRNLSYLALMIVMAVIELPMALTVGTTDPLMIFDSIAMNASDIFFILIIPLLTFYSGRLGKYDSKLKYVFYLFYPLHLWVIHLLASLFCH